ncbi:MAG: phytanoyl-CoA dioxygenase family protein [Ilumatobacter sp.]|uniref:phytanoyl-CoA dioxygenase family protein n=1 Tax=Ilumatobacter sp. TaxID=1967498 RepID=UPI003C774AAD
MAVASRTSVTSRGSGVRSDELGWSDHSRDDPDVVRLRAHLENHNGLSGLEIVEAGDIERAVRIFRRDGFVVIADALTSSQTSVLRDGCDEVIDGIVSLDDDRSGNRGSHRYSFGGSSATRSQLHRPEWQMLLDLATVNPIVAAIFGSPDYLVRSGSGDFCLPGAVEYQPLHSDIHDVDTERRSPYSSFQDPLGQISIRDLPCPYVCLNFMPQDMTRLNGPTRQIPGSQRSREPIPTLDDEPEWMRLSTVCPAPAGSVQIRDVRAWHGGTPNLSDEARSIPNLELYAPWFREPLSPGITDDDHRRLSPYAQHLTRYVVADPGAELDTRLTLRPEPPTVPEPA